jgi:hypothetical protein
MAHEAQSSRRSRRSSTSSSSSSDQGMMWQGGVGCGSKRAGGRRQVSRIWDGVLVTEVWPDQAGVYLAKPSPMGALLHAFHSTCKNSSHSVLTCVVLCCIAVG